MTDADRLAKARREQESQRRLKQAADQAAIAEEERREALRAINTLVPQVLAALARLGYPDPELIRVKRIIGSTERAAWQVAGRQDWLRDGYVPAMCYLLSTGDFTARSYWTSSRGSTPCSASATGFEPQAIEAGLRALLQRHSG